MVPWVFHTANETNFVRVGHDQQMQNSISDCHTDGSLHAGCGVYTKGAANSRDENWRQSQGAQPQARPIRNEGESI